MKPEFLKDKVPDLDLPYIGKIASVPVKPLFIMGLHRSGTTFLYEILSQLLPVAPLQVYHLASYNKLLKNHFENTESENKAEINGYFNTLGLDTRPTDGIRLSAGTVEEYGWLLLRYCKKTRISTKTAVFFSEICKKLLFLKPEAEAVLLKSPWDTGEGAEIYKLFPQSRFIYIKRDPLKILNSQFKNAILFGSEGDPFLMFLLTGSPLGRTVIKSQQLLYRLAGEKIYRKIMLNFLIKDISRELQRYRNAVKALPPDTIIEIDYDELMEKPVFILEKIFNFLNMSPLKPVDFVRPQPRKLKLYPEIERIEEKLKKSFRTHCHNDGKILNRAHDRQ